MANVPFLQIKTATETRPKKPSVCAAGYYGRADDR